MPSTRLHSETEKVSRALDGLESHTLSAPLMPMWALRDELGSLAAKLRETHPETAKTAFLERVRAGYPHIHPAILETTMQPYLDAL